MQALLRVLVDRRSQLISRWQSKTRGTTAADALTAEQLLNSLPTFLDQLAAHLTAGAASHPDRLMHVAEEHGRQRFSIGFDLPSVLREYGLLRECILDLAEEEGQALSIEAVRIITQQLEQAMAWATSELSRQRDLQLEQHESEHYAFLAHELRNPLNTALLGLSRLKRVTPGLEAKTAEGIERSLRGLSELIDNTLVESKLRGVAGGLALEREFFELSDLIHERAREAAVAADSKGIRIDVEVEPPAPIFADRRVIASVVTNLLTNAIKFTRSSGRIIVRTRRRDELTLVEVEDECGGLPEGAPKRLFTPFVQRGQDRSGFGLGLAICKQSIEAHGGSIHAIDLPGRGCVFSFALQGRREE